MEGKILREPIRFYIFLCCKPDGLVQLNEESLHYCSLSSGQPHRLCALSTNQCSEVGWISEVVLLCWPALSLSLAWLRHRHTALTDQMCCFGLPVICKPRNKQINLSHCPLWHNRWVEPCGVRAVCLLMFGSEPSFTGFDMCVCVCVYFCLYIWKHLCGSGLQLSMHCPFLRSCQHADIVS